MKYYRITAYHEGTDMCCIIDCYGAFEKLWQFSSYLFMRGFQIMEVGDSDRFVDVNIDRMDVDTEKMGLRAYMHGKPIYTTHTIDGIKYKAVMVDVKIYVPDKNGREW